MLSNPAAANDHRPRTIQIFLPTGDARGLRVAALTTSIVQVIEVPRKSLSQFLQMPEANQVGVYFLVGQESDEGAPQVYVGQSGGLGDRLAQHDKNKDFWNRVFVVVSLTNSLTQTHALYLEWRSIKDASQAGRYKVVNGNSGSKPHTPSPLEADCLEIFDIFHMLLSTLGQPFFDPLVKAATIAIESTVQTTDPVEQLFFAKSPGSYDASGQYTEEGFVVLSGSKAREAMAPALVDSPYGVRRRKLIDSGLLKLEGGYYLFTRDALFNSPSGASNIVTGNASNGWVTWRTKNGTTLDALKRPAEMKASLAEFLKPDVGRA